MRQGPPVCIHNKPIEEHCRDCGCNAGSPCPCPNLQPLSIDTQSWLLAIPTTIAFVLLVL